MSQVTIINKFGALEGWNSITANMLFRDIEGISDISYTDEVEMNSEYGAGKYPIGQSEGNYKAQGSISLYVEEYKALIRSLPPGTRIQDVPPFPIVVQYETGGVITKDVLNNVRIKGAGKEIKQGDGKIVYKHELLISHIDWSKP